MGAFIGPLGGLIEATQWEEKQSVSTGTAPSFFTGLDGSRTAFVQPTIGRVMREWDVSMSDAHPEQAAAFQALAMGAMGVGPFVFVDPLAQVTNVLTPRQSLMEPAALATTGAGQQRSNFTPSAVRLDGFGSISGGSVAAGGFAYWGFRTPVHPERPVTLSAVVQGQVKVTLRLMRDDSAWTVVQSAAVAETAVTPRRVSVTLKPPFKEGAVMCGMAVYGVQASTIAQPQVTWTAEVMPWAPGRGATNVVVHGLKESFSRASPHTGGPRRLDYSATVTEVGTGA